jgi:hypothetical protein
MARYQEDAQSNTKDNRANPLHTIASPKRLFTSLEQLLALHGRLMIEITLAHTILPCFSELSAFCFPGIGRAELHKNSVSLLV